MKISTILFLSFFWCATGLSPTDSEDPAAILQAVFTSQEIEREIIHTPRYETSPSKLYVLDNEFTSGIEAIQLNSAELVVIPEAEIFSRRIFVYYVIQGMERAGNTATVSFAQMRKVAGDAVPGNYEARVSLRHNKGIWRATRVKAQSEA